MEQPRVCTDEMLDSLGEPYPKREDGTCFPSVGEDTPVGHLGVGMCHPDETPSVVFGWGRFFEACPGCDNGIWPADCRPLVCASDDDCPFFLQRSDEGTVLRDYRCVASLCQESDVHRFPRDLIYHTEAMLLCLADIARVDDVYEGPPVCPEGAEPPHNVPCSSPLPEVCMQP